MRAWPATVAAAAALAGCGGGSAEPRADEPAKPPSGTFDVQGHGMFIDCTGAGEPAVILDSGLGVDSTSAWAAVRPNVAELTRVCIYDRAGMAASEPGPGPRTIETMTGELHELLREAGVEPPYVLAGASLGGMNAQLFAVRHPDEVERLWGRLQEANAKLSPTGRVVVAERSHHRIAEDQPELVVDAIREVVEAARAGG
jgi:pimeloyl-ACP methyl ester carboxylesterase